MFSGILSSIWALGLVPLLGLNLDPLILVIPIFLSARALSHSVQSMDRYHEEYHRTARQAHGDRRVVLAPLPAGHRVDPERRHRHPAGVDRADPAHPEVRASSRSFWIVSILISVVTLHPIILSATNPPGVKSTAPGLGQGARRGPRSAVVGAAFFGLALRNAFRPAPPRRRRIRGRRRVAALPLARTSSTPGSPSWTIAASKGWRRWAGVAAHDRALHRSARTSAGASRWAT